MPRCLAILPPPPRHRSQLIKSVNFQLKPNLYWLENDLGLTRAEVGKPLSYTRVSSAAVVTFSLRARACVLVFELCSGSAASFRPLPASLPARQLWF